MRQRLTAIQKGWVVGSAWKAHPFVLILPVLSKSKGRRTNGYALPLWVRSSSIRTEAYRVRICRIPSNQQPGYASVPAMRRASDTTMCSVWGWYEDGRW